jgi:hypothetical protein
VNLKDAFLKAVSFGRKPKDFYPDPKQGAAYLADDVMLAKLSSLHKEDSPGAPHGFKSESDVPNENAPALKEQEESRNAIEAMRAAHTNDEPKADAPKLISGQLVPATQETVKTMKSRFYAKLNRLVDDAVGPQPDEHLRRATWIYCYNASKARNLPKPAELKQLTEKGVDAVKEAAKEIRGEVTLSLAKGIIRGAQDDRRITLAHLFQKPLTLRQRLETRKIDKAARDEIMGWREIEKAREKLPLKQQQPTRLPQERDVAKVFGKEDRIYFHLKDESRSPVQDEIEAWLAKSGYTDIDYVGGMATDNRKNRRKIGKILADQPGYLKAFVDDPARSTRKLMVVLTRHPYDVARGSFGRGWQSCRTDSYSVKSTGGREAAAGVLAAYLIREDDPNIHDPLTRVFLKPYYGVAKDENDKEKKQSYVYMAFNPIGLHNPGFVDAVNNFAEETFNKGKFGKFKLHDNCESYREFQERTRLPQDGEKALKMLGLPYEKIVKPDGTLDAIEIGEDYTLSVSGLGLTRLPDFSKVHVRGHFSCAKNKLNSLVGAPEFVAKTFDCSSNLLLNFTECSTKEVGEKLNFANNAFLASIAGLPKAKDYGYGNSNSARDMRSGETPVSPLDQPALYPGFKRKN